MKILLIGGTGTLGQAVLTELSRNHQVLVAGYTRGDYQVDITDDASVSALFAQTGIVDAIVVTAGQVHFGPLHAMSAQEVNIGLQHKLLGQIRVALQGQHILAPGGSITLTSGVLSENFISQGSNASTVNAALEGFVRSAAVELREGRRINVVSPTVLSESMDVYAGFFPGFEPVAGARAALAYRRSVDGIETGRVYQVW